MSLPGEGKTLSAEENVAYLSALCDDYPILSIEDGCSEDDWDGWKMLTEALGDRVQLVGDDLFVTNPARLAEGIEKGCANSLLVKVNQIGTLSETLAAVNMAHRNRMTCVMSHRSGRDRGRHHRRPRRGDELRADQDRQPCTVRPAGEVQPADPDRGNAGGNSALRRALDPEGVA
jgi:hypothetical protein